MISGIRKLITAKPFTSKLFLRHHRLLCTSKPPSESSSDSPINKSAEITNASTQAPNTGKSGGSGGYGRSPFGGPITYVSLAITAAVGLGILMYYNIEKQKRADQTAKATKNVGKPALGGPWSLVDKNGIPRTSQEYAGNFLLLYFGFTHCPDICPSELVKVGKIMDVLVDPNRDTVQQLRIYAQDFHPSMVFLTGTPDQVAQATRAFRVYFSKADEVVDIDGEEEYLVDHSIVLYLMSPQGEFLDFFTQRTTVLDITTRIEKHMKEYETSLKSNK